MGYYLLNGVESVTFFASVQASAGGFPEWLSFQEFPCLQTLIADFVAFFLLVKGLFGCAVGSSMFLFFNLWNSRLSVTESKVLMVKKKSVIGHSVDVVTAV